MIAFTFLFPEVNLGALFTTSAIFGVILGLALQDTLGNFFAGISLQADRPFQVGDVITVGAQRHTGVVEEISWRAIKIRTFTNHVVLIANSNAAREPIEVCPRDNLNARLVFFNTLYSDSPAKTIHVVREAVREADNVSEKVTPIVGIRNLGDNGVDYEVKYWLEDYAKYNDTDALVRQRIWYAFRRAGLNFAYPTRTLFVERRSSTALRDGDGGAIAERLSAVDIFAPLSADEITMLAQAAVSHVFAPSETVIRAGEPGSSMFVVHKGRVRVQVSENGRPRTVATLNEGDFFGEMALFTGEPRTANVLALEETEVLEIGHAAMKRVFDTNPNIVEEFIEFHHGRTTPGPCLADRFCGHQHRLLSRHPLLNQAILWHTSLITTKKQSGASPPFLTCSLVLVRLLLNTSNTQNNAMRQEQRRRKGGLPPLFGSTNKSLLSAQNPALTATHSTFIMTLRSATLRRNKSG